MSDFDEFVIARGPALVRLARALLRDAHHAEDVVQDVLVKAHLHWGHITTRDDPDAYVRRMLVNASTSFWRRAARREIVFEVFDRGLDRPVADESGQSDDRAYLLGLIRRLPPRQRVAIALRHYEGMTDDEIARVMGTTTVTVRTQIHRGLAKLRSMIEESRQEAAR